MGLPPAFPVDEQDRALLNLVRPPDWVNPLAKPRYNLVVIGGGSAGLVCAKGAAGLGARVALVEAGRLGGDCLNQGCVPSKALLASARQAAQGGGGDFATALARMRGLRARLALGDSLAGLTSLGVDVFLGRGRFTGPQAMEVAGQTLNFARAVIATGSRPEALPFPGLEETGYLTNENVFDLTQAPASLAVLGTGPLGCELAQAFARLGTRVMMVGRSAGIMTKEDPQAAEVVAAALRRDGVDLRLRTGVKLVERQEGMCILHLEQGGQMEEAAVETILLGAGRRPNLEGLGLEAAGVEYDPQKGVAVDDHLRTSNHRVYAAGDACLATKFTHAAEASARLVIHNALFVPTARWSAQVIPWCTYTDPELAQVGLTPGEAKDKGVALRTIQVDLAQVDRAVLEGRDEGLLKVHVAQDSDRILGATLVAAHAGEMMGTLCLAMSQGLGLGALAKLVLPYPTRSQVIKRAADAYQRGRLTPRAQAWLRRWLSFRL
jgi:pyruvate/2-oxoglutarate dehydrogenase complex dihydrolipoamide dehydrogenase (E3) component